MLRRHAPGLFFKISSNRLLRAVYRRLANPTRTHAALVYATPAPLYINVASEAAACIESTATSAIDNSTDMLKRLRSELAAWKPGKRIDA